MDRPTSGGPGRCCERFTRSSPLAPVCSGRASWPAPRPLPPPIRRTHRTLMNPSASARPRTASTGTGRSDRRQAPGPQRSADRPTKGSTERRDAGPADQRRRRRRTGRGGTLAGPAAAQRSAASPRPDNTAAAASTPAAPERARSRRATRAAGPATPASDFLPSPELDPGDTDCRPTAGFAELGVPTPLLPLLGTLGAHSPFPIQSGPPCLRRSPAVTCSAAARPAPARPSPSRSPGGAADRRPPGPNRPRSLILLPTRELALQVARTVEPLAKAAGLRAVVVFGGVGYGNQTAALRGGVDIVIACPGRLEDLVNQRACDLSGVELTVLDEADHMADLGFLPVVRRLLRATPPGGQRLLFSATLDNGISVLVKEFCPTRCCTRSTTRRHRCRRWITTSSPSSGTTAPRWSVNSPPAGAAACCSPAPSTARRSGRPR